MKVYNETDDLEMPEELKVKLEVVRKIRSFNASNYINEKSELLNAYMRYSGLDTCLVAVSGGIDSAVTLGIVCNSSSKTDSPIKNVCGVLLPCYDNKGVVGQESATSRGKDVCARFKVPAVEINMHDISQVIMDKVGASVYMRPDAWAIGQLVPYSRTSVLYYLTSLYSANCHSAIIVGTTNFSEGGYLGYVGKASDGMVDVQLISDIYKSEVYKVAEELRVPKSVFNVTPTGDMYDNRTDVEVFGAPYDFVELYQEFLRLSYEQQKNFVNTIMSADAKEKFTTWSNNLEKLHMYNKHKYLAGSPAVHLDLWDSNVEGGWHNERWLNV